MQTSWKSYSIYCLYFFMFYLLLRLGSGFLPPLVMLIILLLANPISTLLTCSSLFPLPLQHIPLIFFIHLCFLQYFFYLLFFLYLSLNVEVVQGVSPGLPSWYGNSARDLNIASIERKICLAMINSLSFRYRYLIAFDWMYHGHWKYNISKTELLCPVDMLFLQRFSMILLSNSCSCQKTKNHSNNSLCLRLQHLISYQTDKILTTSIHFFPRNQVIMFFLILHIKVISQNPVGFTAYEFQPTFFPSSLSPIQFQPPLSTTPLASQWKVSKLIFPLVYLPIYNPLGTDYSEHPFQNKEDHISIPKTMKNNVFLPPQIILVPLSPLIPSN